MFSDFFSTLFKRDTIRMGVVERHVVSDKLTSSTDGYKWAVEFMARFGNYKNEIDEGLMISWFCNAIEAGKNDGYARGKRDVIEAQMAAQEEKAEKAEIGAVVQKERRVIKDEKDAIKKAYHLGQQKSFAEQFVKQLRLAELYGGKPTKDDTERKTGNALTPDEVKLLQEYINQRKATFPHDSNVCSVAEICVSGQMTVGRTLQLERLEKKIGVELHRLCLEYLEKLVRENTPEPMIVDGHERARMMKDVQKQFEKSQAHSVEEGKARADEEKAAQILKPVVLTTAPGKTMSEETVGTIVPNICGTSFEQVYVTPVAVVPKDSNATGPDIVKLNTDETMLLKKYTEARSKYLQSGGMYPTIHNLGEMSSLLSKDEYDAMWCIEQKLKRTLDNFDPWSYQSWAAVNSGDTITIVCPKTEQTVTSVASNATRPEQIGNSVSHATGNATMQAAMYDLQKVYDFTLDEAKALYRYATYRRGVMEKPRLSWTIQSLLCAKTILEPEYRLLRSVEIKIGRELHMWDFAELFKLHYSWAKSLCSDSLNGVTRPTMDGTPIIDYVRLDDEEIGLLRVYAICCRRHQILHSETQPNIDKLKQYRHISDKEYVALQNIELRIKWVLHRFDPKIVERWCDFRKGDRVEMGRNGITYFQPAYNRSLDWDMNEKMR